MDATPTAAAELAPTAGGSRWEISRVLSAALKNLRWGLRLLLVGGAVLVVAQVASVYRLLADIHPWVGAFGAVIFAGLVGWLLLRPLWGMIRLPVAAAPPKMPPLAERRPEHVRRQLDYLERYLATLARNPELADRREQAGAARSALTELRTRAGEPFEPLGWGKLLVAWERDHLHPLLEPLDRQADALVRKEALAIGTMTALSPNGTVDAFLVLWRNLNLVAALARIYYGRPGVRGTWLIVRDVASAILLSSVMEHLSDLGGNALRRVMGEGGRTFPLVGAMVGPVLDGTVNGLMAMKVGYLAKERCRSYQAWDERTTQSILKRTFGLVADSAGFLVDEMRRTVLGSLSFVQATAGVGRGAVHGVGLRTAALLRGLGRFLRVRPEPGEADPPDAPASPKD